MSSVTYLLLFFRYNQCTRSILAFFLKNNCEIIRAYCWISQKWIDTILSWTYAHCSLLSTHTWTVFYKRRSSIFANFTKCWKKFHSWRFLHFLNCVKKRDWSPLRILKEPSEESVWSSYTRHEKLSTYGKPEYFKYTLYTSWTSEMNSEKRRKMSKKNPPPPRIRFKFIPR